MLLANVNMVLTPPPPLLTLVNISKTPPSPLSVNVINTRPLKWNKILLLLARVTAIHNFKPLNPSP